MSFFAHTLSWRYSSYTLLLTPEEESALKDIVEQSRSLQEIAEHFHRSPEAIRLKIRRLGLEPPVPQEKTSHKATTKATATRIKPTEKLITPEEAMKMWLGCVKRLSDPDVTSQEVKKIRLILTSLKGYVVMCRDYIERIILVEERQKRIAQKMIDLYEMQKTSAQTEEEKAKWQKQINDMKAEYKEMEYPEQYHIWARRANKGKLEL